jgi:hypothetical protein
VHMKTSVCLFFLANLGHVVNFFQEKLILNEIVVMVFNFIFFISCKN